MMGMTGIIASSVISPETTMRARILRAVNVVNGIHRGVFEKTNRWISDPAQSLPQWLELRFREPRRLREVPLARHE